MRLMDAEQASRELMALQALRDGAPRGSVGAPGGLAQDISNPYKGNYGEAAITAGLMSPGIGDIAGPIYDVQNFMRNPESRTIPNYALAALGILPGVPSLVYLMNRGGGGAAGRYVPRAQAGMIGGATGAARMARGGNAVPQEAMQHFELREAQGASREELWSETAEGWGYGIFRGKDGKIRFEIDDSAAKVDLSPEYQGTGQRVQANTVGMAVDHPELMSAYPDLAKLKLRRSDPPGQGSFGTDYVSVGKYTPESDRSVMLHELQHGTQEIENFAKGTSPKAASTTFTPEAREALDELNGWLYTHGLDDFTIDPTTVGNMDDELANLAFRIGHETNLASGKLERILDKFADKINAGASSSWDQYRASAGEVEARAVQKRRNLTVSERAKNPFWNSYDVPEAKQIVKF